MLILNRRKSGKQILRPISRFSDARQTFHMLGAGHEPISHPQIYLIPQRRPVCAALLFGDQRSNAQQTALAPRFRSWGFITHRSVKSFGTRTPQRSRRLIKR